MSLNALRRKLTPRWQTAAFPPASADNRGIIAFDTTLRVYKYSDGTAWLLMGGGGSGESAWSVQDLEGFGPVLAPSDLFQNILIVSASPEDDAAYVATRKGQPATEESAAVPPSVFMGIGGLRLTLEKSDGVFSLVLSYGDATAPFALHLDRDSGRVSFCPNVPEYARDAAADADALLKPGAFYKLTASRQIFQKPW